MHKSPQYDTEFPPGQIVNNEYHKLAVEARNNPRAKTLGDIINKTWKNDMPTNNAVEQAFRNGRSEGYTQGYYDGILAERHKWVTNAK